MPGDFPNRKDKTSAQPTAHNALSDEQLMAEVQRGDGDAFTVALRIVHDVGEAQEVAQNVFFEFYRSARRFDPARGKLKVWLLQFAYRRSINRRNYLLLRQFYNRLDLEDAMAWEANSITTPRIPAQELKQVVEQTLTRLPETQKRVVEKVIFEGVTLREVAKDIGSTYDVVRNNYYRALHRLRVCLVPKPVAVLNERILGLGEVSRGKA